MYLAQPFCNVLLMAFFEWGVALHDVDLEAVRAGEKSWSEVMDDLHGIAGKARAQIVNDYGGWPLISAGAFGLTQLAFRGRLGQPKSSRIGDLLRTLRPTGRLSTVADVLDRIIPGVERTFWTTLMADATANVIRNVWAHGIIFCGHFPDQTYTFSQEEVERETRGGWYVHQLVGAANIEGSPLFHIISGNLGYQVEHHLYPDMPSSRYAQIAPRVREICERYELLYNSGGLVHQWSTGAPHHPAARVPRRKTPPEAGPVSR